MALMYSTTVPLGSGAIDFSLPGTDGKTYSLGSFKNSAVLGVVFTCNHCPYAQAVWPRLIDFQSRFASRGVQLVGINPNDAQNYADDRPDEMKKKVREMQAQMQEEQMSPQGFNHQSTAQKSSPASRNEDYIDFEEIK